MYAILAFTSPVCVGACSGHGRGRLRSRQSHLTVRRDQHVLRRYVAVHHAERLPVVAEELVRGMQARAQASDDTSRDVRFDPTSGHFVQHLA